jgi:hypothetical protein
LSLIIILVSDVVLAFVLSLLEGDSLSMFKCVLLLYVAS